MQKVRKLHSKYVNNARLIDEYGLARELKKQLEKKIEEMKDRIDRAGLGNGAMGERFELEISECEYQQLDTKKLKAMHTETWITKYSMDVTRRTVGAKRHE
ncbi:hypothetical protein N9980_00790 [bacterium]|nr:hypothetical protein [bacterium]